MEKKGRTRDELDAMIRWLTGYLVTLVDELAKGRALEKVLRT